jgi:oxygen-independent coproporphyrinogen-3 oxidase
MKVRTVFCGGGTPTLLPLDDLARLLAVLNEVADPAELDEFTVEANPATVDEEKSGLLVRSGVGRVSMGAQSFFPAELAVLERIHSPEDVPESVARLRASGIRRINLDLIFGIPGQTLDTWSESLRQAIALDVDHIACYGLTYEPGTPLTALRDRGRLAPCDERLETEMYFAAIDQLAEAGYEQYEISNFARSGCPSKHNLIYWRNEPYLGVGPSACGCWGGRRYKNIADTARYIRAMEEQGHAESECEWLDKEMLALELILMQLRLNEGLSLVEFERRTGRPFPPPTDDRVQRLVRDGLLAISDSHVAVTRAGRVVANAVMADVAAALDSPVLSAT